MTKLAGILAAIAVVLFEAAAVIDGVRLTDFLVGNGVFLVYAAIVVLLWAKLT